MTVNIKTYNKSYLLAWFNSEANNLKTSIWLIIFTTREREDQQLTCNGGMLSAANSTTRANLTSWCELKTHCTKRLGSQLWLINLAIFPVVPASMQNSGKHSDLWSSGLSKQSIVGIETSRSRLYNKQKSDFNTMYNGRETNYVCINHDQQSTPFDDALLCNCQHI